MYTDTQQSIRNAMWNFMGTLLSSSPYDEISKKKENVTALMSEELCKFVKADDKTLDIKAAKPILKSALWILEARKLELKNINVSNSAINSGIKEIDILIATLSKYIDKI